ncbi:MAG: competence/damage-inducible protein A [Hyphomicrobiaceae bacterium]|nr:competence/damage-inducible protein A [Hyphomicrobiaceae bacterium]
MSLPANGRVTAAVLVIGDEILSGRTKDQHIGWIADHLTAIGIDLKEVRIVPDDGPSIIDALTALRHRHTYVFTTGGIGPTHDDITADCVAKAFGVTIGIDQRAVDMMTPHYASRGVELTPARLRMARIPSGATLVANPISAAPGFMIGNVIVMAGVPLIMRAMLEDASRHLSRGPPVLSRSIKVAHPEGEIAELLRDHQNEFEAVSMGSYPQRDANGQLSTELVLRSADAALLQLATDALISKLEQRRLI